MFGLASNEGGLIHIEMTRNFDDPLHDTDRGVMREPSITAADVVRKKAKGSRVCM